jgi:hypothetical protein
MFMQTTESRLTSQLNYFRVAVTREQSRKESGWGGFLEDYLLVHVEHLFAVLRADKLRPGPGPSVLDTGKHGTVPEDFPRAGYEN